ncbi:hypothetical protein OS493_013395 [Desmophyllum pertusum]|uniref:Uncharacterized protein n=1 Tax=Desmophyllum pertusum TaxID=174260 RepID=A0A9W9YDI7_9CNID|nr:hypothetical protein OS493_013395 [Desmophyllum pertusum]
METVKLKTIELGQDEIVNNYRKTQNKQSQTRTLQSQYSKWKEKIFKLFTMTNNEQITDETLPGHINNTTNCLNQLTNDDEEWTHIEPIESSDKQLDNTAQISIVCFETADSNKFSTNETTANQHDLAAPTSSNGCFDHKVKQEQFISLQDSIQFTQTTSNCSNLDENLACSIDIDATSSSFKSNSWRETPLLTKHPPVFNETSAIQLMSGQNALINGDQLLNSQPNYPAITQGLPPPYTYKICRKRKPPDKV